MPNGYFNGQVRSSLGSSGKGTKGFMPSGGASPAFKEKPGFAETAQGKTQPTDRSAGVKRIKAHPSSDGI